MAQTCRAWKACISINSIEERLVRYVSLYGTLMSNPRSPIVLERATRPSHGILSYVEWQKNLNKMKTNKKLPLLIPKLRNTSTNTIGNSVTVSNFTLPLNYLLMHEQLYLRYNNRKSNGSISKHCLLYFDPHTRKKT